MIHIQTQLYLAALPPIDLFDDLSTYQQAWETSNTVQRASLKQFKEVALEAMKQAGLHWEGDIHEGPYLLTETRPILQGTEVTYGRYVIGLVWKQDNNGTTFMVSLRMLDLDTYQQFIMGVVEELESRGILLETFSPKPTGVLEEQL